MKTFIALTFISFLVTGCFKSAEEIRREKMVDKMSEQLEQSSRLVATLTQQVTDLQSRLDSTSGQLEEIGYKTSTSQQETQETFSQTTAQLAEQVNALKMDVQKNKMSMLSINESLSAQKKYLDKINKTLASLGGMGGVSSDSSTKSSLSTIETAHKAFEKNQQTKAKDLYLKALSEDKVSASQKNHIWHNLGLLDYWNKRYDDAAVWFSKVYTKYPKSSWAPRSLLYIARCFKKNKKMDEAKATYAQLIKEYPSSKYVTTANEEMK